ncbi:MAG: hypothetical protein KBC11_03000 [Candidatus Pacebacteria bacterium]|nr:hypothetical protein [Candidatus Paceibacterota bacterium]
MKKMFFLVAILFATTSFAQFGQKEMILNPGETGKVITNPCPNDMGKILPVEINYPSVERKTFPSQKRRVVIPSKENKTEGISNSFNITTTTTNNYYPTPLRNPDIDSRYFYGNDWLVPLLLLLIVLGLIFALFHYRNNQNPTNPQHITIQTPHSSPAPKPVVINTPSESEINNALEKAKDNYGTFWRDAVGGYRVDFPKPKEEKKPEEKVADPAIENKENKKE